MTADPFVDVRQGWDSTTLRIDKAMRAVDKGSTPKTFAKRGRPFADDAVASLPPSTYPTIIELGAGGGRVTRWLQAAGYSRIYAVDIAPGMVSWLKTLLDQGTLDPEVVVAIEGDGTNLGHLGEIDGVYSTLVLMHNPKKQVRAILAALYGLVRPGGRVAFQLPVYERPRDASKWSSVAQWTIEEMRDLAATSGFVPTLIHENEGTYTSRATIGPNHWALHLFDKPSPSPCEEV